MKRGKRAQLYVKSQEVNCVQDNQYDKLESHGEQDEGWRMPGLTAFAECMKFPFIFSLWESSLS